MRVIDYFDKGARLDLDATFLIGEEASWTYREAYERSVAVATALRALGTEVGDRVGVLAPNGPEAILTMVGLWRAGATWVPLNSRNSVESNVAFMNEVGCKLLFLHPDLADPGALLDQVPTLERIVSTGAPGPEVEGFDAFLAAADGSVLPDWNDPFGLPAHECASWPTGGTTGASKAVIWTNQVWATLTELATRIWPTAERTVNLLVAPVTHAAGVMAMIFASQGATVVVRPGFDAADVLDQTERHQVTHMFLPPTAFYDLLAEQEERPRDVSSLKLLLLSAAPVAPEKLARGVEVFGPCLAQSWGQAEAPFILTYLSPEDIAGALKEERRERLASCGRPTFSAQVAVLDEDGRELPPGERGELCARGRLVTPGYLGRPQETAAVREFDWHHTGDVGYADEAGFVYIVDRKKDMIITGGFNVYPAEIESAILELAAIRECAVIGIPDERWGEMVLGLIVPEGDGAAQPGAVIAHVRQRLGSVKAPKRVITVDKLPRTAVGKVDKKALRADYWGGRSRAVN
jgi:acyl-CoA synthetase (AMP-forming)/AMP-acid ligase II